MSGLGKLGGALYQLARGQPNAFVPGALGTHVALRLLQTHSESQLGAWIIHHPWLAWPGSARHHLSGAVFLLDRLPPGVATPLGGRS